MMFARNRAAALERGFSLIEVSIALVILSMIMVATLSALRSFANTQAAVESVAGRVDNIRLFGGFLRNSIGSAMPVTSTDLGVDHQDSTGRTYGSAFSGTKSELVWVAPMTSGATLGGVHVMRLGLDGEDLVLWWIPFRGAATKVAWGRAQRHIVMEKVEEFTVGYRPGFDQQWLNNWVGRMANPVAVSVNAKVKGRYWPEMIIRLNDGRMNVR